MKPLTFWAAVQDPRDAAAPGELRTSPYHCLDCLWKHGSAVEAYEHHRATDHHRVVNRFGQEQVFSCCTANRTTEPKEQTA